jgi:hypothetical protein
MGITTEFTVPHTPHHNGHVERRFATDARRAQAMMEAADLTIGLRNLLKGKAINTYTYLGNMCINPKTKKSSYEFFYNKKPPKPPTQLMKFGRIGFVTHTNKARSKYSPKAFKCFFVGYSIFNSHNTFRLYNTITRKVFHSRDVK